MKTVEQTLSFIEERIGHIYYRPRMYGGDARGTNTLLQCYHELWSITHERIDEFENICREIQKEQNCGSASFSTRYKLDHPNATDEKVTEYVVFQWKKVGEKLNIQIPYDDLEKIYKNHSSSVPI